MPFAVLVIDVQQAFRAGEYQAFDVERILVNINRVTKTARSLGVPVVFIQHESTSGVLAYQAPGWKLADDLAVEPQDHLVRKTASDAFHQSDLADLLRSLGATELVVCGIQSDFCVDSTVRRALALGFDVRLVEDGHTTLDNGVLSAAQIVAHHSKTLTSISSFAGTAVLRQSHDAFLNP